MDQINELVKQEISRQLLSLFKGEIIAVTSVSVSRDLSFAKVWVSALNDVEKIAGLCQREAGSITHSLAGKLPIKRVPRLKFLPDLTPERADRIEHLIDTLHKNEDHK
mgnify:FL=1